MEFKVAYIVNSLVSVFILLNVLDSVFGKRRDHCPEVRPMKEFNIFAILGPWYVVQYYSSAEEALTYDCMRVEFGLSNGNMDMKMRLSYKYAADPNDELQTGNITWQIPDPMRPEHWRHTEDHYKGVYNTDVIDTDHTSWLILLHCSDPESEKKFLSTFVLSRTHMVDKLVTDYLREKVSQYDVNLEYLFPVNQTFCYGEINYPTEAPTTTTTKKPVDTDDDLYFEDGDDDENNDNPEDQQKDEGDSNDGVKVESELDTLAENNLNTI